MVGFNCFATSAKWKKKHYSGLWACGLSVRLCSFTPYMFLFEHCPELAKNINASPSYSSGMKDLRHLLNGDRNKETFIATMAACLGASWPGFHTWEEWRHSDSWHLPPSNIVIVAVSTCSFPSLFKGPLESSISTSISSWYASSASQMQWLKYTELKLAYFSKRHLSCCVASGWRVQLFKVVLLTR